MSKFPKTTSVEKRAKSIEEATELALNELNVTRANAKIEIIQEPAKGFLGIGGKDAIVKVTAESKAAPAKTEKAPAARKPKREKTSSGIYNSENPEENAKNFITNVLNAMGIEVSVSAKLDGDMINVEIQGDNMGVVIGKRGDTLDSLQYLTSLVVNQKSEDYIKVSIDTENYRQKREEALCALAKRLSAKVARTGKKFALEPMNPYERRIIHSSLQNNDEVTTFSIGQEPYRKVVIAPKNPKSYTKRSSYSKSHSADSSSEQKTADTSEEKSESTSSYTYKADFKPQQHKAEYKNFEEYLAAHSKD